ncbi:hypothetical protein BGW38_000416, partial [Lunasporangiospora selenospora]
MGRWIQQLRTSKYDHIKKAAANAQPMNQEHLDSYYRDRVVIENNITSLENSFKKLADLKQEFKYLSQDLGDSDNSVSLRAGDG